MISRRSLIQTAALAVMPRLSGETGGIFPILNTPLTPSGRLDTEALLLEVDSLDRCGVHGMVWPATGPIAGAEAVMSAAKGRVILGVCGPDIESTRRLARHAEKLEPYAILAAGHYRAIVQVCGLPLMAHAAGSVTVEFVLRLRDEIPTLRLVKDEAGHTLSRISEYRRAAPELTVFTAARGRTLPDELERGASGTMPSYPLAQAYVRIWAHCRAGRRGQAIEELSQISMAAAFIRG